MAFAVYRLNEFDMISEFNINTDGLDEHSGFSYARKIKGLRSLTFTNGLNLILGQNGSGKSTLAKLIAAGCWADKAGFPHLTKLSVMNRTRTDGQMRLSAIKVVHDGQVLYADAANQSDPETDVGKFLRQFTARELMRISHGERTLTNMGTAFSLLQQIVQPERFRDLRALVDQRLRRFKKAPPESKIQELQEQELEKLAADGLRPFKVFPPAVEEPVDLLLSKAKANFKAQLAPGKPTLLLDEPDRSLSISVQGRLWAMICDARVRATYQIIVVSHSFFALEAAQLLKGANVIEMSPNFVRNSVAQVDNFRQYLTRE